MREGSGGGSAAEAGIRTFLIADVRGYTLFTQERGDEAAAKLAARFAAIAREVVDEHGGSVIELRGDEALAVFASARQAILAATDAQDRFLVETIADPTLPLPVGIGLDVGEAVPLEGGYRGGALNLAARLCGKAGPGEILASQGVIHLARKVDGVRVLDKGTLHLKGLPEPVGVFRLVSEQADPAVRFRELAPREPSKAPAPVRLARRHPIIATLAALALVVAIAVPGTFLLGDGGTPPPIAGDALAVVDAENGELEGSIALGSRPGDLAVGRGAVWVTLPDRGTVQRVDPTTMTIRDTVRVGADPVGVAIGFGSVWVTNGGTASVSRIDPSTGEVVQKIDVPGGPAGIAVDDEGVWVASSFASSVSRIDPETGDVEITIGVGNQPVDIAVDRSGVWVANAASGTVSRIDPAARLVVAEAAVGNAPEAISARNGAIWVANSLGGTVAEIDTDTNTVAQAIPVVGEPTDVALAEGSIWVSNGPSGSVTRIEQTSETATRIGSQTGAVAVGGGSVWVGVRGSDTSHRGGTLTVSGDASVFDSLDPAIAYVPTSWGLLALTNDGLVGYRRSGGLEGTALVPNLARSIPEPADGGRSYTFQLRSELEYSSGQPVQPQDFRRAIERVFASVDADGLPSGGVPYYSGIVGADACRPGEPCDLSEGIVTDDAAGTVTFRLTEPDPDFLHRLALPFASAVPSSTPDVLEEGATIPATGPYVVQDQTQTEIVLVRNPAFRSWSPAARPDGFADEIVWRHVTDRGAVDEVLAGTSDLSYWFPEPGSVANLASAHAGQLHLTPQPAIFYMSPNTAAPPFDDVRVRQALNLAVDRAKVQRLIGMGTPPTCQILPPNFPGYVPYCPYTASPGDAWTAPDLDTARSLVAESGTDGMRVTVWSAPCCFPQVAPYFRDLLQDLGYRATLRAVDDPTYGGALYGQPRRAQLAFIGWFTDYLSESGYVLPVLTCGAPSNNTGFCDEDIDHRMARAARLQITDPSAAHEVWSEIEHDLVDQAPWIPLVARQWVNLVSERLGNFQVNPFYGPLIDQMWVR